MIYNLTVPPVRDISCLPGSGVSECGGGSFSAGVGRHSLRVLDREGKSKANLVEGP